MVGLSTRGIIEQGHWSIASVILDVMGRMVEAHIVKPTGAAQGAPEQVVFPPFQPCSIRAWTTTYSDCKSSFQPDLWLCVTQCACSCTTSANATLIVQLRWTVSSFQPAKLDLYVHAARIQHIRTAVFACLVQHWGSSHTSIKTPSAGSQAVCPHTYANLLPNRQHICDM